MVAIHPASSPEHLPFWFTTGPGQTDALMVVMGVVLVLFVLLFGVVFLRLHHPPEHIAQKQTKDSISNRYRLEPDCYGLPMRMFSGMPPCCWQ